MTLWVLSYNNKQSKNRLKIKEKFVFKKFKDNDSKTDKKKRKFVALTEKVPLL